MSTFARGLLAALAVVTAAPSFAAPTQGSLGSSSTGSVNIQASVPSRVRISGLSDISLLNSDPAAAAINAQDVCVWSNANTRGYNITALGSGTANAFTLGGAGLTDVPYSVAWAATSGQTSGSSLTAGTPMTGLVSAATTSSCNAGPASSASLIVSINSSTLESMSANSTYTGTLTLVVAPE